MYLDSDMYLVSGWSFWGWWETVSKPGVSTYTGTVDAVINPTERLDHVCHGRFDRFFLRHVALDRLCAEDRACSSCDAVRCRLLGCLEVNVYHENTLGAGFGKGQAGCP